MQEKIKILMVLGNTRRGGTQAFIMNVLRNIDRVRFQIDFALNLDFEGGWGPEMKSLGSNIFIMPVFKVYNWITFAKTWESFLSEHHYDIIHGHTTNSAGVYLKIAQKKGCKTIAHIHSTGYRGNVIEKLTKKLFSRLAKKYADYWFACSPMAAEMLFGDEYKKYPRYYEMPNAIDVRRYRFDPVSRNKIRKEIGLTDENILCGHVGTFSTPKNHTHTLRVFCEILKQRPTAKLLLIGEGNLKDAIHAQAKNLGIFDKIIFKCNLGNVNEYLMAMDLFIFPSLFEGFGMVSLEAQATGLNVIQSNVVPKETLLTECVKPLPLSLSPVEWAYEGLKMEPRDRASVNEVIASTKYNLKHTVDLISRLYTEMKSKQTL